MVCPALPQVVSDTNPNHNPISRLFMAGNSCRVTVQLQLLHVTQPEMPGVPEETAGCCCDDASQLIKRLETCPIIIVSIVLFGRYTRKRRNRQHLHSIYHSKPLQSSLRRFWEGLSRTCEINDTFETD